jgi:hypothetical protein
MEEVVSRPGPPILQQFTDALSSDFGVMQIVDWRLVDARTLFHRPTSLTEAEFSQTSGMRIFATHDNVESS